MGNGRAAGRHDAEQTIISTIANHIAKLFQAENRLIHVPCHSWQKPLLQHVEEAAAIAPSSVGVILPRHSDRVRNGHAGGRPRTYIARRSLDGNVLDRERVLGHHVAHEWTHTDTDLASAAFDKHSDYTG